MDISKYVFEQLTPLVASLYVVGIILKQTTILKDKFIPLTLLVLGILGSFGLLSLASKVDITTAIIQGILATGMAILINEVPKQLMKSE